MGASSRSPSPITMVPRMGIESMVWRMASVATWSDNFRSPWPMVWAEAIAATSTTRRNRDARSLSMFSPKQRTLPSVLGCVAMNASKMNRLVNITRSGVEGEAENAFLVHRAHVAEIIENKGATGNGITAQNPTPDQPCRAVVREGKFERDGAESLLGGS